MTIPNFGAVAAVNSIFPVARPKRAVSAVFRAPGGPNGGFTSCTSPRRSDAPGKLSAPKVPFSHINIGSLKKKRDSGPFRGSSGRNAFRETAENGQRPLGETALPGRLCTNLKNPKGSNNRNWFGSERPFWGHPRKKRDRQARSQRNFGRLTHWGF